MMPNMFAKGRLEIEMCILFMNSTGDVEEIHRTSDILHRNWKNVASYLRSVLVCRKLPFPQDETIVIDSWDRVLRI